MIKERHVIRMKIPFPSLSSKLACSSHMYICVERAEPQYKFVKCQTLKPYMLIKPPTENYCDEPADITRNPFMHKTRIDCDKRFKTSEVEYDDRLLTPNRPDICEELFSVINEKLLQSGNDISLNEEELVTINPLITKISLF